MFDLTRANLRSTRAVSFVYAERLHCKLDYIPSQGRRKKSTVIEKLTKDSSPNIFLKLPSSKVLSCNSDYILDSICTCSDLQCVHINGVA